MLAKDEWRAHWAHIVMMIKRVTYRIYIFFFFSFFFSDFLAFQVEYLDFFSSLRTFCTKCEIKCVTKGSFVRSLATGVAMDFSITTIHRNFGWNEITASHLLFSRIYNMPCGQNTTQNEAQDPRQDKTTRSEEKKNKSESELVFQITEITTFGMCARTADIYLD